MKPPSFLLSRATQRWQVCSAAEVPAPPGGRRIFRSGRSIRVERNTAAARVGAVGQIGFGWGNGGDTSGAPAGGTEDWADVCGPGGLQRAGPATQAAWEWAVAGGCGGDGERDILDHIYGSSIDDAQAGGPACDGGWTPGPRPCALRHAAAACAPAE